jgi:methionyl-tRNA formyltransferase
MLINTGNGLLRVLTLQLEGESEQNAEEFFSSHTLKNDTFGGNS